MHADATSTETFIFKNRSIYSMPDIGQVVGPFGIALPELPAGDPAEDSRHERRKRASAAGVHRLKLRAILL